MELILICTTRNSLSWLISSNTCWGVCHRYRSFLCLYPDLWPVGSFHCTLYTAYLCCLCTGATLHLLQKHCRGWKCFWWRSLGSTIAFKIKETLKHLWCSGYLSDVALFNHFRSYSRTDLWASVEFHWAWSSFCLTRGVLLDLSVSECGQLFMLASTQGLNFPFCAIKSAKADTQTVHGQAKSPSRALTLCQPHTLANTWLWAVLCPPGCCGQQCKLSQSRDDRVGSSLL